jgi:hypothetical protein
MEQLFQQLQRELLVKQLLGIPSRGLVAAVDIIVWLLQFMISLPVNKSKAYLYNRV